MHFILVAITYTLITEAFTISTTNYKNTLWDCYINLFVADEQVGSLKILTRSLQYLHSYSGLLYIYIYIVVLLNKDIISSVMGVMKSAAYLHNFLELAGFLIMNLAFYLNLEK